jgi:hypothetical protein
MLAFLRPPFFSDAALSLVPGQFGHLFAAMPDGLRVTAEELGDVFHATMAEFLGLHGCVATSVLFRQGFIEQLHVAFHGRRIVDHDSIACCEG